uniref:Uncharacterized protein n=1 Tax=Ananas comosus var. bracteatus TaxID=296719 RepID=A0A6V7NMC2_ANACO|nr:unnamed protein product [Ananas comosus var. bracteatus]
MNPLSVDRTVSRMSVRVRMRHYTDIASSASPLKSPNPCPGHSNASLLAPLLLRPPPPPSLRFAHSHTLARYSHGCGDGDGDGDDEEGEEAPPLLPFSSADDLLSAAPSLASSSSGRSSLKTLIWSLPPSSPLLPHSPPPSTSPSPAPSTPSPPPSALPHPPPHRRADPPDLRRPRGGAAPSPPHATENRPPKP